MPEPGAGERRAATGYHPQYRVAAELTIAHLRDLEWIKVADPSAGVADDFQLAVRAGPIHALQVKWSGFAGALTFRELTAGEPSLVGELAQAWKRIRTDNPGRESRVHLVSNDYASRNDSVRTAVAGEANHFAAFIARALGRARAALRRGPVPDIRSESYVDEWQEPWEVLRAASGLDEPSFWEFISAFELNLGVGHDAFPELARSTPAHRRDIGELADCLFGVVADPAHVVRLTHLELLERLGWTGRLTFRSQHVFPVPTAYQPNERAVADLIRAIETHAGGYLAVAAPAGAGKSSLLTATDLPALRTVHYYAYTPASPDPSTGRGESENFFFDLVTALDGAGLHTVDVVDPRDRLANKDRLLRQFDLAGRDWQEDGARTIIVIDGLDHIPREQNPARSLIDDLPLPTQVPDGVFLVLGTQLLDILPVALRSALSEVSRVVDVPPLDGDTVLAIATASGPGAWLQPEQKQRLVELSEGHPLALTYLLEGMSDIVFDQGAPEVAWSAADSVLAEGATYRGSVLARYEGYWQQVADVTDVRQLLGIVSRIRSPLHLGWLRTWNTSESVRQFVESAAPFFIKDGQTWNFIHNSFRQFLIQRTATIGGAFDPAEHRRLHAEAAEVCAASSAEWSAYGDEELAQRVHAEQHTQVLDLASPARLRARLLNLAPSGAITLDTQLALRSAAAVSDPRAVLKLALVQFELELRQYVLEPHQLALALIDIGEYHLALSHVIVGRELRLDEAHSLEAAIRLRRADRIFDASAILHVVGSLSALLATSRHGRFYERKTAELVQWWVAAHAEMRSAGEVLLDIDRALPVSPKSSDQEEDDEDASPDYRAAALVQLAAAIPSDGDRSAIISALSLVDPAGAAIRELDGEAATSVDALAKIDAALAYLGVTGDDSPTRWTHDALEPVPIHIRVEAAEVLLRGDGPREVVRRLVENCAAPSPDAMALDRQQDIWLGYRLQRLRYFLGLPRLALPSRRPGSDDVGLELFRAALDELAELDASVWRSRLNESAGPGPVMTVARRLHRLFETPMRERRRWTSWYVAMGAAPKTFSTLVSIATAANREFTDDLHRLFVDAWNDETRSQFWGHATRIAVLGALAEAGVDPEEIVSDLSDVRRSIATDVLDAHSRVDVLLQLSRLFEQLGAPATAREVLVETVAASLVPGAHDNDDQLREWVERFGDVIVVRPQEVHENRALCITMAERLVHASHAGASVATAAAKLIELSFAIDSGLAADLTSWFEYQGVLDGPEGLAAVLEGAANAIEVPAWLTADVTRSLYMPVAIPALESVASKLVYRGGDAVREVLKDGVSRWVLPSFRVKWGSAISAGAEASEAPVIGEPPSPSGNSESDSEPRTIRLSSGEVVAPEDARRNVSSPVELVAFLASVSPSADAWRRTPLGPVVAGVAQDLGPSDVPLVLAELERVNADEASFSVVASSQVAHGSAAAAGAVEAAMRSITLRGWSSRWDGGTRRKLWASLVAADSAMFRDRALDDLATALRVDAVQLSGLVHDLPSVLPIIGLDASSAWDIVDGYLEALCRPLSGPVTLAAPPRNEGGTASLLRVVGQFAGHPVRTLEWGARKVMRRALQDPMTSHDAAVAVAAACTISATSAEAMLGAAATASGLTGPVRDLLAAPIRDAARARDQIVRDTAERAAGVLGVPFERAVRRPLPLSYSLSVPPVPPRAEPMVDDEGIAVLDPTNPRAFLGSYDMLLDGEVSRISELNEDVLIRQAARFALETADLDPWTRGGVRRHADRLKASGWLHGYRPWALMTGRRGTAAVLADLVDARVLPNPAPTTVSVRLGLLDPVLDLVEPEAKPDSVLRPARRDRWGASLGNWTSDTLEAARIYSEAPTEGVLGEWSEWTEFSWERAQERRVSVVGRVRTPDLSGSSPAPEVQDGALRATERLMHLGAFDTAAEYRALAARLSTGGRSDLSSAGTVVGGREWWAEARTGVWLALDPALGVALGWRLEDDGLFVWTDDSGTRMAWSRWWIQCLDTHQPPHFDDDAGEGWQVLVSAEGWSTIVGALGPLERRLAVARSPKRTIGEWDLEAIVITRVADGEG